MTTSLATTERAEFADALAAADPGSPTLCEGWTARDLAAHVVLRERNPLALPGILVSAASGLTQTLTRRFLASHSYEQIVSLIRSGPPRLSPMGASARVDAAVNTTEMLIHHEDLRRAQPSWQPREFGEDRLRELWGRLRMLAKLSLRSAPVAVTLTWVAGGGVLAAKAGSPLVVVCGDPVELAMFATGRQRAARVEYSGEDSAVERLRTASLGT